ncbi:MAG: MFS transporter [Pseudomonadota bacterium]
MTNKNQHQSHTQQKPKALLAYLAWFTCALFFFYQYILRVAPGVMIDELRHEFSLTAQQFSTLGVYFLLAYSLLQIPLGAFVDRFGVRLMITISVVLCIAGTILLWAAQSFYIAQCSRILVGTGSATAFMCALKITADYFPEGRRGLLMGMTLSLGTVGALTAGKPLVILLDSIGWRPTVLLSGLLGLPLVLMAVLLLPGKQSHTLQPQSSLRETGLQILEIIKNRRIMLYALLAIGLYTPLAALADLWGTAFLMQKFSLPRADAAQTSMMMYLGMAAGSLLLPWLCEKYNILNRSIQVCGFALLALFAIILYGPAVNLSVLVILLLSLGFFCGAEMMCFTGAVQYTTPQSSGLTLGVVNTMNMLGGAILQFVIGFGLDWQWQGLLDEYDIRVYSTEEFVFALTALLIVMVLCCWASLSFNGKKGK